MSSFSDFETRLNCHTQKPRLDGVVSLLSGSASKKEDRQCKNAGHSSLERTGVGVQGKY